MVGASNRTSIVAAGENAAIFVAVVLFAGCSSQPTLEELEDEAIVTGDWEAVERREERRIEWLEASAPNCPGAFNKVCVEEQTGIECYCVPQPEDD